MRFKIIWPGKTKNRHAHEMQTEYLRKIRANTTCELIETKEAKGISEKNSEKIKEIEAKGLEKYIKDDYIICLLDRGKEMDSEQFAQFLKKTAQNHPYPITFIVGGFLGLADRILKRAHVQLSLSKMTYSHELTRVVLLEQIYRAVTILQGKQYAK